MTQYTFYFSKRKLVCEYVDKYNKLSVLENNDAIECLNRISKFKYNSVNISDDIAIFKGSTTEVNIEDYEHVLKKYKLNSLFLMIIKQDIINKIKRLITPSKIFIFYVPTILIGAKLLNLPKEPTLYAEGIKSIEELAKPIDLDITNDEEIIEDKKTPNDINYDVSVLNIYNIDIECYDKGDSSDTKYVIDNYGDIIEELSNRYGFSPNLIIGMVTQESHGVHENLMQVVFNLNADYISKRYNFETNKYDTIVLTNSPEEYPDVDIVITEEMMKEPYYALLAGINSLRINYDEYSYNNMCSAIEMFNKGYGNWMKVLRTTSKNTSISVEDILYNPEDLSYTSYTDILNVGDKDYLKNVMQYVPNAFENGIYVKTIDNEGNVEMIKLHVNKTLGKVKNK